MKKKNNGFTLIEILAVIVILGVVMMVAVPGVLNIIRDTKMKAFIHKANGLVESIINEVSSTELTDGSVAGTYTIVDGKIVEPNSFKYEGQIPETGTFTINADGEIQLIVYDNDWCVTRDYGETTYTTDVFSGTCEIETEPVGYTVYPNGTAIYFNPVTGTTCTAGEAVSTTGTKTGCMKWYTFNDGGNTIDTINLILDHNTTAIIPWNSSASNTAGPNQVLTQLKSDTSGWTGVATRTDTYALNNGTANYTIDYSTYKARLITAGEIATITDNITFNELSTITTSWFYLDSNNQTQTATTPGASNYAWLFDYTYNCTVNGCNVADNTTWGYWTATAVYGTTNQAWNIHFGGYLYHYVITASNAEGVRPVITLPKSVL